MKIIQTFFLLLISGLCYSQIRTSEIGLITDNDLYTSSKNDMYYTNGLTLFYRYVGKNSVENEFKTTNQFYIGQNVYTPRYVNAEAVDDNDRPFAGYLFAGYEKGFFKADSHAIKVGFAVGTIGPNSYAQGFQENFHKIFNYKNIYGWENQIRNALAFQINGLYFKKLSQNKIQNTFDLNWQSTADFGTIFTGMSTGLVARIGFKKRLPLLNSSLLGASVGTSKYNYNEFYFYAAPSIRYQVYDATIQGSLFSDTSPVTFPIEYFRFNAKAGLAYRRHNWNLSYAFVYTTKEVAESPAIGYFYGSIGVSVLLP
ncbi:lipid A deacylase LpxR family protein [Flavobacterium agrisoli]|uniref:Lipid A deacylase LpxR family protein n=1 Tax=Flavobacterium agrisoli TaxID=2793066 RepID=A0A934PNT7_9FLAO|nr:lipid A deacylase LpxR family protein [Flavobacterium agrisoli]MBK0369838.1 lipid A deacylase LpxR family protein [Flavobacterium agrisoli]